MKNQKYTEIQLNAVNRILKCKNLYEILGVSKDASTEDIVKAYKKLALIVHTDKNQAPRAKEAFQMLSNAVEILRNEVKRKAYNASGQYHQDYMRGFKTKHSAKQVFRMIFGLAAVGGLTYLCYKLRSSSSSNQLSPYSVVTESFPHSLALAAWRGGVKCSSKSSLSGRLAVLESTSSLLLINCFKFLITKLCFIKR